MPTYTFQSKNWPDEPPWEEFMSISERDAYLEKFPNIIQVLASPALGDPTRLGLKKPSDGFRDILRNIKKKHIHSTVNTF